MFNSIFGCTRRSCQSTIAGNIAPDTKRKSVRKALAKRKQKPKKGKPKGRVKHIVHVLSPEEERQREEAAHAVAIADWEHDTARFSGIMTKSTFCDSMFELVRT